MSADAARPGSSDGTTDLVSLGIGLLSSHTEVAKAAEAMLRRRYSWADASEAEILVALGGDGFMPRRCMECSPRGARSPSSA